MLEMEVIQTPTSSSTKRHVREPPSVPFLWETRPGIPKKDWQPDPSPSLPSSVPTVPPVKLIASVPFLWEEKPGIPLPAYSQPSQELVLYNYYMPRDFDVDVDESIDYLWDENDEDQNTGSEAESSNGSVAPSLMANCLVSSLAISSAVPAAQRESLTEDIGLESESESESESVPSSPESENGSSTSSYATGNSSLVGSSFLECLFPLFPPNSGFLGKVGGGERSCYDSTYRPLEVGNQKPELESIGSVVIRRPSTLGELIMMSRRRSCWRKATQMETYDISMELAKSGALGCCGFRKGRKMIEALHIKKAIAAIEAGVA